MKVQFKKAVVGHWGNHVKYEAVPSTGLVIAADVLETAFGIIPDRLICEIKECGQEELDLTNGRNQ